MRQPGVRDLEVVQPIPRPNAKLLLAHVDHPLLSTWTATKIAPHGGKPALHRIGRRVVFSSDVLDEWARRGTFKTTSGYRQERRS
jgi:hypothetical protein